MASISSLSSITPPVLPTTAPSVANSNVAPPAPEQTTTDSLTFSKIPPAPSTPSPDNVTGGIYTAVAAANASTIRGSNVDVTT